ncbi:TonB-dependent receptor [Novosphingobium sp. ERN07]|uniref:TonB-dependent receptor n=1 Tax=unclassified Novosphingobium TaxID=2644732 RepID=UPI0014564FE7|nr:MULTISPECIES: TonB-dependent receptor [unclassified Novosphingobium]NLR41612.1 TonB-dependent receptor [Novosphingobium sp. ERW19]NLR73296.1 TonB-dependent receptor [Novosphingobium sp. ERN07]
MRNLKVCLNLGSAALGLMAVCGSPAAHAQDTTANDSGLTTLQEIVVTAQHRSENLQNVPIAVSAINAEQIEQRFSRDIAQLGGLAPNVVIDTLYGANTPIISVRGVQLNDGEKSFDPAVAVYLDGVYLATTTGALLTTFDASEVEILRGPQGTLFGRNTIGGLVHVRRAEPTGEFGGRISATYGSFEQMDFKGVMNLPSIADGAISAKVGLISLHNGGYFRNIVRNKREGDKDFNMFSASVKIEPSSSAKLVVNYDYIDDNTPTTPVTSLTGPGELFCIITTVGSCGAPASDSDYHRRPVTNFVQPQRFNAHSLIANGEVEVAPDHNLLAVVGYRTSDEKAMNKFDGLEQPYFFVFRPQTQKQFSGELRYQGTISTAKIVAGAYYYSASYEIHQRNYFFPSPIATNSTEDQIFDLMEGNTVGGETPGGEAKQRTRNYAFFGQVDWEAVPNLTLSVGGRYTHEKKRMCAGTATGTVGNRTFTSAFGDCPDAIANLAVYTPNAVDPVTGAVTRQTGILTTSRFTPRFGVSYKFDNGMVYASYSKGFRSGGFNGRASSAFSLGPYQPETVRSIEAGFKSQWFDNRLRANVNFFRMDYSGKQEDVVFPDPVLVTLTVVQNAAKARMQGVEGEFQFIPAEGLTLGMNVGYLDAKYLGWLDLGTNLDPATAAARPLVTIDKSGFSMRRAPKWSLDANAVYRTSLGEGKTLILDGSIRYKSRYFIGANTVSANVENPLLVKPFAMVDASITYETGPFRFSLFGKNLTNRNYFTHVLDVGTGYGATPTNPTPVPIPGLWTYGTIAAPRTFGIEAQVKF